MKSGNIVIQSDDIESAQIICGLIQDEYVRNRAVANVLAAKIASNFFDGDSYSVDIESGLHNLAKILNDIDMSDIYINGSYVDVRVYFDEDEICVPKMHFDYGITPVAYMFIKLRRDLTGGTVTGFILPNNINQDFLKDDYYYIKEDNLVSIYDIENHFQKVLDTYEGSNEKLYEYIDGILNANDTIELLRTLLTSKSARLALLNVTKAQSVFNFVSVPEEIANNKSEMNSDIDLTQEQTSNTQEVSDVDDLYQALDFSTETTSSGRELIEELGDNNAEGEVEKEDLETLFNGNQNEIPTEMKKKGIVLPLLLLIFIVCTGYFIYSYGYPWYLANYSPNRANEPAQELPTEPMDAENTQETVPQTEAMPNEQVETDQIKQNKEEGNQLAIPEIEKHLDASILVSNLKVDWEVPSGYVTNTAEKYYFIKLGKKIQLNLKSELLLLTKPPISNRIEIELQYNPNKAVFDIVGFKTSSGEKTVDNVILNTIKSSLNMKIGTSAESFAKAQGNPVILIRL